MNSILREFFLVIRITGKGSNVFSQFKCQRRRRLVTLSEQCVLVRSSAPLKEVKSMISISSPSSASSMSVSATVFGLLELLSSASVTSRACHAGKTHVSDCKPACQLDFGPPSSLSSDTNNFSSLNST
ncbi:hypothetical protein E1B28_008101 [Marasmius oreades]|uniref:Uncharacterized protein n=1 Tax=Marasmius oreades TaxID=181124 RepID=A0A9P7URS1_9AGAR|nr:uncharacterized protein E1B28_008101 [Marasmius oreades]KAG7091698.1 hypothetical protein E1B28_008101 [Marasmius oreades]